MTDTLDDFAERFVRLGLSLGAHDEHYVDAYYGPAEWRDNPDASLDEIGDHARDLLGELEALPPADRQRNLAGSVQALVTRVDLLGGTKLTFDEESTLLYGQVAPHRQESYYAGLISRLDDLLPGQGEIRTRYDSFAADFFVRKDNLASLIETAIAECRARTLANLELPDGESFRLEYVSDKPWAAQNWYKGGFQSLIDVNQDSQLRIDSILDLAAHEGYPGHHVCGCLYEQHLVRENGWQEFTLFALFSPVALMMEGIAMLGVELAFPGNEQVEFEREALYPLAGLDPEPAQRYHDVQCIIGQLDHAGNDAARGYIDGNLSAEDAVEWLRTYALMPADRAQRRLRFIEEYRSYVINYTVGLEVVRAHFDEHGGPAERWKTFEAILRNPAGVA